MTNLRLLPSIDALLHAADELQLRDKVGGRLLTSLCRSVTDELRRELARDEADASTPNGSMTREALLSEAKHRLRRAVELETTRGVRRVINATGVVLHTNLGRAPLSSDARQRLIEDAAGYCTLEYDLESGLRGRRAGRVDDLLCELTGAEAALVVNNCAAAALLVLSAIARDGETIVSRGELVEIGGDFRIPDVMAQSGSTMVEVGTTNRTKLRDYEQAVSTNTRLVLRVHPSNYRIVGFAASPTLKELADFARERRLILYEDAGSGALIDLTPYGLAGEPAIRESIESGADLVSFSGDKLLGGPQAGIIVGRRDVVEALRQHPIYRALRPDKLALAALEGTLEVYRRGKEADDIPSIRMIATTEAMLELRVETFANRLTERLSTSQLGFEIVSGNSAIGGGSAPTTHPPTKLIVLRHGSLSTSELERALRMALRPVVTRVVADRVAIDLRTVSEEEEDELLETLVAIW